MLRAASIRIPAYLLYVIAGGLILGGVGLVLRLTEPPRPPGDDPGGTSHVSLTGIQIVLVGLLLLALVLAAGTVCLVGWSVSRDELVGRIAGAMIIGADGIVLLNRGTGPIAVAVSTFAAQVLVRFGIWMSDGYETAVRVATAFEAGACVVGIALLVAATAARHRGSEGVPSRR